MAQSASFIVLVAALLINTLSFCSAENVYCVTPTTATSCSSCPHNSTKCTTLAEYAQEADLYFTSNTTMVFLPGDHVLAMDVRVVNTTGLTLRSFSDKTATVVRNELVGFSFTNVMALNVYSLAFTSSNWYWSYGGRPARNSAFILHSIRHAKLVNCSFQDNSGTALVVINTNVTLAENNAFIHNQCGCASFTDICELGCGITALNSNLTFTGNTNFLNNRHSNLRVSEAGAGAILAVASSLEFNGINNFCNNVNAGGHAVGVHDTGGVGGAIYLTNNAVLAFHGTNNFINNSADNRGGAIFSSKHTVLNFTGTNNFIDNHIISGNGGAIYLSDHVVLIFSGMNNFINNSVKSGSCGAISAGINNALTFIGTSDFNNNSAKLGSAICIVINAVLSFNGMNKFINNSAERYGGAIYTSHNTVITFNGTNKFSGNSAKYADGGAIYANSKISLTFIGTSDFSNNSAGLSGGAISVVANVVLSFTGTNNFLGNHVNGSDGGAVSTSDHVLLTFNGSNNFINNSADYGGAIYAGHKILLVFIGTSDLSNNSAKFGGAICMLNKGGTVSVFSTVLTFNGTNKFSGNSADKGGGAVFTFRSVLVTFTGINTFIRNYAHGAGGAIYTSNNVVLSFTGTNNFINNHVNSGGGAIRTSGNIVFNGTNNFIHNSARIGGAIRTSCNNVRTFNGTNSVINLASIGGTMKASSNVVLTFNGTNNFIINSASVGGAISASGKITLTFIGTSDFINNSAEFTGGAISTSSRVILNFTGTNTFIENHVNRGKGGAINMERTVLTLTGTNSFINNSAYGGGAISTSHFSNAVFTFMGINNFTSNSASNDGGAIFAVANISLSFTGTSSFSSNSAMQGGAISANVNSKLTFDGNISFTNNGHSAGYSCGGAMYLAFNSTFSILPHTTVCWENNHASLGGAIYVINSNPFIYCPQISTFLPKEECFFQLPGQNIVGIKLVFKNNSAVKAGSVLYGGTIDNCKLTGLEDYKSDKVFDILAGEVFSQTSDNTTSYISSDPFCICPCDLNNHPNCSKSSKSSNALRLPVYPGEKFQVSVVSTGQRNGIVSSVVRTHMDRGKLESSQYIQQTTKRCTTLNYTVFSQKNVILKLYSDGPCSTFGDELVLELNVNQTCPPGFNISREKDSCVCDLALQIYTNHCNITNGLGQITRESDDTFWVGYDQSNGLTVHPHCPFDYCANDRVSFPLNNTNIQCAYNRSGLLCGACNSKGDSLILGSSQCKKCTNIYLLLLIPFSLMGIALVFLIFVCKLTVATGTLSGLVFYANIVGINRTIFLPVKSTGALSVFIAWLNLDFGIETCLYDGMDAYSKTWLQFVFPAYIWLLVGLIIAISHYSQRFANLLGNNPVSVLATLILLSYAKILQTLITAVSFIDLHYQYGYKKRVWLNDANIDYLIGKHIPLFLLAVLVFLFLFLPYTLLLLFGQWLQAISHLRFFSWVNSARLKPFMDSYHAPYKAKHRYWPGLLLVLRFVLLLVFALNPQQDLNINLLAILVGAGLLQLWAWVSGGMYKNWSLDALEGSFALNLIILVGANMYIDLTKAHNNIKQRVGYTSVIVALVTFICILSYHIFQQLRQTNLWGKMPKLNLKWLKKLNMKQAENNPNNNTHFDQLREPWLEDMLPPTQSVV